MPEKSNFNFWILCIDKVLTVSTGPLFLNGFIEVADGNEAFEYEGYALARGLFLAKCLEPFFERQWFFQTRIIGLQGKHETKGSTV
nr:abc transporter c family member 10 [Quercus suber]